MRASSDNNELENLCRIVTDDCVSLVATFLMKRSDDEDEDVVSAPKLPTYTVSAAFIVVRRGVLFDSVSNTQLEDFALLCKGKTN